MLLRQEPESSMAATCTGEVHNQGYYSLFVAVAVRCTAYGLAIGFCTYALHPTSPAKASRSNGRPCFQRHGLA